MHVENILLLAFCFCLAAKSSSVNVDGHIPPAPRKHAMDARHETQHITDHLNHIAKGPDLDSMSPEQLEFHYFKLHDDDNDNRLDGIEIGKALTHFDRKDEINSEDSAKLMSDTEVAELVDSVLKDEDLNGDGYIDYTEFVAAQKRDGVKDVQPPHHPETPAKL